MFRNFARVTEVAKINSKACLYFSIDRRLVVTEKNLKKRHRNHFHFYIEPQASRCTHMSRTYTTCVPKVTVSEMKGFTSGLSGLEYGSDSRVCS